MKFIRRISRIISWIERSFVVFALGMMIVLAFLQVILRNYFSTGILWADPLLRHAVIWVGFLGASLATQEERHINIDIVTRFVSPTITNRIRIATNIFAAIICALLANAGWTFLKNEMDSEGALFSIGGMNFQSWWFQLIIPVGFGLMAFRFLLRSVEHTVASFNPTIAATASTLPDKSP